MGLFVLLEQLLTRMILKGDIKMLNKQVHDCNAELSDLSRKIETEQQQQMRTADL